MIEIISDLPVSSLRQRMIDEMNMRRFARKTQIDYVRHVERFAYYLGRPPDTATPEDVRQFQIDQQNAGVGVPTMNSIVSALRFFFTHTIDRPDLCRRLYFVKHPRSLPTVLSPDEVARLLGATTSLKHQAALSVAYGAGLRVADAPDPSPVLSDAQGCLCCGRTRHSDRARLDGHRLLCTCASLRVRMTGF